MKLVSIYLPAILFVGVCIALAVWSEPVLWAQAYISGESISISYSYLIFVLVLAAGVVVAPLASIPLVPIGSMLFGPFIAGILSVIAWTLGATIAFFIARHVGRPVLERWLDFTKIDRFLDQIPDRHQFWFIVVLRHTIPVDILSYALGLTKSLRFSTFFFATLIGVIYFSFAFAYLGEALFKGNWWLFTELGLVSVSVLAVVWYAYFKLIKK